MKPLEQKAEAKGKKLQAKNLPYGLQWLNEYGEFMEWYEREKLKIKKMKTKLSTCPACKKKSLITSIFGSICARDECAYNSNSKREKKN